METQLQPSPTFSVVTPSYNMLEYLKCCHASVLDQEGASLEHIVMDGGSKDGTAEWMSAQGAALKGVSEPDQGMYDALNKGFARARGEFVSYLNCDEQYLPGTLKRVEAFFRSHPEVDLVFSGALLIRPDGSLISYRKAYPLRLSYVLTDHLYLLSCTLFFRRTLIEQGVRFDPSFRAAGDAELVCRLLQEGRRVGILPGYASSFCMTGSNLSLSDAAMREQRILFQQASPLTQRLAPVLKVARRFEKFLHGGYRETFPLSYAVYPLGAPEARKEFLVESADFRWRA